jgi:medium-chain acyl-[acyl-carrier-protein] hydrolase
MPPRGPAGDAWLPFLRPRPSARLRLFCFPYAGGGASLYRGFQEELPAHVEVAAVQLPGRETRVAEAPVPEMQRLVPLIADGLAAQLDPPFAFFGYSMGSLLAFELARELRRRGAPLPVHLVAAACRAPHLPDEDATHTLPDGALIERLRALGGMSEEVLAHRELMEMVLPIFRADASVTETYAHVAEPPLDVPITAVGGLTDEKATRAELSAWQAHTRRAFALAMLPGGHFFLRSARALLLSEVARALGPGA